MKLGLCLIELVKRLSALAFIIISSKKRIQSQGLAINPKPLIPQNPRREEGIPPLRIPVEIKDDLFYANFGKSLNSHLDKRPSSKYNSNALKKGSLRKRPYSHIGHWEEFKDGMSSELIEGESSYLEAIPIFSPSMPALDVSSEPIFQLILDPDDLSYTLSPKSHDDPRNPLRQPKHRNHEDQKDDQEMQRQWLECMKNSYAIAKEWMDKDEALWVESKLGLDPNGELKSTSLINKTHPSLEAFDEINQEPPIHGKFWTIKRPMNVIGME